MSREIMRQAVRCLLSAVCPLALAVAHSSIANLPQRTSRRLPHTNKHDPLCRFFSTPRQLPRRWF